MINLEHLAIATIINNSDSELFLSLHAELFSGPAKRVYKTIAQLYKGEEIPSLNSVILSITDECPVEEWCNSYDDTDVDADVIINELNNNKARDQVLDYMISVVDAVPSMSSEELVEVSIGLTNVLVDCAPTVDDSVVDFMDVEVEEQTLDLYTTGLCQEFDYREGGFASGELILMGGIRGSGKSIITQNILVKYVETHQRTGAFFNLEMSPANLNRRLLAQITQTPYSKLKQTLNDKEKMAILRAKARYNYKSDEALAYAFSKAESPAQLNEMLRDMCNPNDHKLKVVNQAGLTLTKLEQHIMKLKDQHDLGLVVVDYLNILKDTDKSDSGDWLVQQKKSERLKELALRYDITIVTPIQIHNDGSAKRAKSVEDAADRVFKFFPKMGEQGRQGSIIDVYQAKARDNEAFPFQLKMDWPHLTIDSSFLGKPDSEMETRAGVNAA